MKKIIVASANPAKVNAALDGFLRMFPDEQFTIEGIATASGVGDQPVGEEDTLRGAMTRAENVSRERPDADFWVGIESGIEDKDGEMRVLAWAAVRSRDGIWGKGSSGVFVVPPGVRALVLQGKELGSADDEFFGRTNSKQANGAIGLLTGDVMTRSAKIADAVIFALIPFKNSSLYRR